MLTSQTKTIRRNAPPEQPVTLQPIPVDQVLTTRQVAAILNMSIDALKKWRRRNIGPTFLKLDSGAVRYRLEAVLSYLSDYTVSR